MMVVGGRDGVDGGIVGSCLRTTRKKSSACCCCAVCCLYLAVSLFRFGVSLR